MRYRANMWIMHILPDPWSIRVGSEGSPHIVLIALTHYEREAKT